MSYGIKETTDVFRMLGAFVTATEVSLEDGKFTASDLTNYFISLTAIPEGIRGIREIPKEWGDLDEAEVQQLRDEFGDIVDDPNWQRAFFHAVSLFDSIFDIVQARKAKKQAEGETPESRR